MSHTLVAFDTEHIKRYVFATDRLKEIRGASSLLDLLNRVEMRRVAEEYGVHEKDQVVYAHGGGGLFLVRNEVEKAFQTAMKKIYAEKTGGGASLTAASVPAPDGMVKIDETPIPDELELLQWALEEEKAHPLDPVVLPSHPFMRLCDACGMAYADASGLEKNLIRPDEENQRFCTSCLRKRDRDEEVRKLLEERFIEGAGSSEDDPLWHGIINGLRRAKDYDLKAKRPEDFNVFSKFRGSKDYLGLIYADANNMGRTISGCTNLESRKTMAEKIDQAIQASVCQAIVKHLKVDALLKPPDQQAGEQPGKIFPFDILLMGGDDLCMVVPASVAMDVALTLAVTFRQLTDNETFRALTDEQPSLSVAVVLAPIKYPFGLLQETAETALKFAEKAGAKARKSGQTADETRINFLVVTGSYSSEFQAIYQENYSREDEREGRDFHATLRPYTPTDLGHLLKSIRAREGGNLGRTKLHQVREAVLRMNLTTSVSEGMAVLRNWTTAQRNHVVSQVYEFAGLHQMPRSNPSDPVSGFPRVTFPWFSDGKDEKRGHEIYRTSLLDFVELYDFVSRAEENGLDAPEGASDGAQS